MENTDTPPPDETNDENKPENKPEPEPPFFNTRGGFGHINLDPLRGTHVSPPEEEKKHGVDLSDLVFKMRDTVYTGQKPETAAILATQAHLMNLAFNRLIIAGANPLFPNAASIDTAVRVQRRCHATLAALEKKIEDDCYPGSRKKR